MSKPLLFTRVTTCLFVLSLSSVLFAQPISPYLYGIHDHDPYPGEFFNLAEANGRTCWVTSTVAIGRNPSDLGGVDFTNISNRGHTVICRLNHGYCDIGTIPLPEYYDDFAQRCANFVANSSGCRYWIIGNETNLATEWPNRNGAKEYVSPQMYADCFRKCYDAIKNVDPNAQVISQALAPFAGPYGSGSVCGYSHVGMSLNWVTYLNQMLAAIATSGPLDGIALHINSRGYGLDDIHSTSKVNANGQLLYFSFYVYKDWVDYGIPQSLWHLPLYATECNGIYYWKGGFPGAESETYQAGWIQEIYAEINRYNAEAITLGKPIYRCVNMYRWCATCDEWNIDGSPQEVQIMGDYDSAYDFGYTWPSAPTPLSANFSASPVSGPAPLEIRFNDQSLGGPTSWLWSFGDGETSTEQHPTHTYDNLGTYDVTLTVQNASDSDSFTQNALIEVIPPLGPGDELIANGSFSTDLTHWQTWIQRDAGDFSASLVNGVLQTQGSNYNAGVFQQFPTGGAGIRIEIDGNWGSQPTISSSMWGEVIVINSDRLPVDGTDETSASSSDNVQAYRNNTYLTPAGWFGLMSSTSLAGSMGGFTSANDTATILLKSGNAGVGLTGVLFDNVSIRIAAANGDFDGDGEHTFLDFLRLTECLSGPGQLPAPAPDTGTATQCLAGFDFDSDDDLDLSDYYNYLLSKDI